ncbi:hypothetical protein E2C01_049069 [Portunus trituberculatus]|uniref:Uncharacterized protein n=1 Tax=Portunus trituberculatus TaxID=210409 RepID=A0A5B7GD83_PORTR|nr:hypothetical protein [Portunus trituberculatus]
MFDFGREHDPDSAPAGFLRLIIMCSLTEWLPPHRIRINIPLTRRLSTEFASPSSQPAPSPSLFLLLRESCDLVRTCGKLLLLHLPLRQPHLPSLTWWHFTLSLPAGKVERRLFYPLPLP